MMDQPLVPAVLALPMAALTLLVLGAHLAALGRSAMERRRRRIRTATTLLMMFTTPVAAYGFGIATRDDPRMFVLAWTAIPALLFIIIVLALLDMLNTLGLHRRRRRDLRRGIAAGRPQEP